METAWSNKVFFRFNEKFIENKYIKWHTDNYASNITAKSGSKGRELQELARNIFDITFKHNLKFDISWIHWSYSRQIQ